MSLPAQERANRLWPLPFLSLSRAVTLLRIGVAGLFLAHAVVRVMPPGTIASFAAFFQHKGFPMPTALVWLITAFELIGGTALMLGRLVRVLSLGFIVLLTAGIVLIHWRLGWFVGEHGTGGSEYSVCLMLALLVIAAADEPSANARPRQSPSAA